MKIEKSRHSTHLLHAHLVFVTKYRYKILTKEYIDYLKLIFAETIENMGGYLIEFDGESEHIHLLIQYPPKWSISVLVNTLKGKSSRMLRKNFPDVKKKYWGKASLWSRSYFAGSVGGASLDVVKKYIEQQKIPK